MFDNPGEIVVLVMTIVVTWITARATAQRSRGRHTEFERHGTTVDAHAELARTPELAVREHADFDMIRIIEPRLDASA